jgi:hypothetical protein
LVGRVPGASARAYHRRVIIGVDIGNSAAKAALVDGSTVHESGRLDTSVASPADLTEGLRLLAGSPTGPPTSIVAVSVVDRWTARLEHAASDLGLPLCSRRPRRSHHGTAAPDLTGPDDCWRFDGGAAAWLAGVVIDLGTATTVDAVDADGFFLGGASRGLA